MANAQTRGWGPPCNVPKITLVRADGLRLPTHRDIRDLVAMLMDLTELMGYNIIPGETWGGLCRKISGTDTWSNHAWWLAIDLNAPSNPYASVDWHRRNARGTRPFGMALVCNIPQAVIELWEAYGFFWGGRYKTKPDPMHMEFMQTPAKAKELTEKLRQWIANNGSAPAPTPIPVPQEDEMVTIIQCNPGRDEWPEIKPHVFKTNGLRNGTEWVPTGPHAAALHDSLRVARNDTDDLVYVSPNLLVELIPDEFFRLTGIPKPTKKTHPQLNSPYLPAG